MLFKNLRSRSKSSSKSSKPSVFRVTSTDSHPQAGDVESNPQPTANVSPSTNSAEADDYEKFLAKAKKEAEKLEKKKARELEEAVRRKREVNMSPWARPGF